VSSSECPSAERLASNEMTPEERGAWLDHAAECPQCHAIAMVMTMPGPASTIGAHERIGRFVIARELGRGAMGVVYAADDPELGRPIAIKVLHDAKAADRLRREARALARLDHPNVVRVYDVGVEGDRAFVAMELVGGENLRMWLSSAKRELAEVLGVLVQAGRGLAAAHAAGIVHRDFKPDNVFVAPGRVVVGDFGLSRLGGDNASLAEAGVLDVSSDDKLTMTGALVGTPAYMAPEQAGGEATPASDQFAFCVAAWEACCGARPFAGPTLREIREQATAGLVLRPVGVTLPRRLERALRRGLAARAEDRFPSMDALVAAIEPRRKRRAIVVGVAACMIAGAAWWWASAGNVVDPCVRIADSIDEAWTAQAQERVRAARGEAGVQAIARYVSAWREARIGLCHESAKTVEAIERRAAREACYDRARVELARDLVDPAATGVSRGRVIPLAACESGVVLSEAPGTASDPRGCGCPYLPCTDAVCTGQCNARAFRLVGPIPGVAQPDRQEAVNGATLDGSRLLYLSGRRCALDHLYLADRTATGYTSTDLTPQLSVHDVRIREGCCTLARDGSGLIVERASAPGFLWFPLEGTQLGAPDPTPFAQLSTNANEVMYMPVPTADLRTFYFVLYGAPDRTGVYEARRSSLREPFSVATKLTGRAATYEYVSGVSDDERTMFMAAEFATRVLVREKLEEPYGDLGATIPPSRLPGWRAIPIDGCRRLITTVSPGGCQGEQSVFFEAVGL
jgi:predicted Ser/Thr protein kinase